MSRSFTVILILSRLLLYFKYYTVFTDQFIFPRSVQVRIFISIDNNLLTVSFDWGVLCCVILKYVFEKLSVLLAYPLRVHYELYTHPLLNLDHNTTLFSQLCSIELPMYSYSVLLPHKHSDIYFAFPFMDNLMPWFSLSVTHDWPLFARIN